MPSAFDRARFARELAALPRDSYPESASPAEEATRGYMATIHVANYVPQESIDSWTVNSNVDQSTCSLAGVLPSLLQLSNVSACNQAIQVDSQMEDNIAFLLLTLKGRT